MINESQESESIRKVPLRTVQKYYRLFRIRPYIAIIDGKITRI